MPVSFDTRPRILLVGGASDLSGVPRHICQLASALRHDAQITVISDVNLGGYDDLSASGAQHNIITGLGKRRICPGFRDLMKALQKTPADLVWLHAPLPALMARLAMAARVWRPNGPVVFTYHAQAFARGHRHPTRILSLLLERAVLALSPHHHIVFLSHIMATQSRRSLGVRSLARHTTHILPNCAHLGTFPRSGRSNSRHLVMTGRANWQKNHKRAFRLFAALPKDTRLTLCGPGTDHPLFQKRASKMLSKDAFERIAFVGAVQDVRPYLAMADAYLLTSRYEGQPIGALEAYEAGLPIIFSGFDGAAELVRLHPCGLGLSSDCLADAQNVINLIDHFRAHESELRAQTRTVWQAQWSADVFNTNYRAFFRQVIATT